MAIPDWVHLSDTEGNAGEKQITVSVDVNNGEAREAVLSVATVGGVQKSLTVKQAGNSLVSYRNARIVDLTNYFPELLSSAAGGRQRIGVYAEAVYSNGTYEAVRIDTGEVSVVEKPDFTSYNLGSLTYTQNTSPSERTGTLTLEVTTSLATKLQASISVRQAPANTSRVYHYVRPSELDNSSRASVDFANLPYQTSTLRILVTKVTMSTSTTVEDLGCNDVKASFGTSAWITETQCGVDGKTKVLRIDENTTTLPRTLTGTFTVNTALGRITQEFTQRGGVHQTLPPVVGG